ncbi:MAG: AAA family ATPase [Deltaproteobacteria bacterium]|nr:AAA family ATPase [Deltaproteobacteria bacterium]
MQLAPGTTLVSFLAGGQVGDVHPAASQLVSLFNGMRSHVGWEVMPSWVGLTAQRPQGLRVAERLMPARDGLSLLGLNLVSVVQELNNSKQRNPFLALVGAGLELDVEGINVKAAGDGVTAGLFLRLAALEREIPSADLSTGQLAWLCWAALLSMRAGHTLVTLDQPEDNLHFALIRTLVNQLCDFSRHTPVVVATHSNDFLDALPDPASQLLLFRLGGDMKALVTRPSKKELAAWMEQEGQRAGSLRRGGVLDALAVPATPRRGKSRT